MHLKKSVEVVTRISRIEIPYLLSFVEYYLNEMKVDRISFFIRNQIDFDEIKGYLMDKEIDLDKVKTFFIDDDSDISYKSLTPLILENTICEYLLIVDCDEFLQFDNSGSLKEFMKTFKEDYVLFKWKMFVHDQFVGNDSQIEFNNFTEGHDGKYLVKKDSIEFLEEHFAKIIDRDRSGKIYYEEAYVLHFCLRGFEDAVLKTVYQKFTFINKTLNAIKYQSCDRINEEVANNLLPNRFQIMAFLKVQTHQKLAKPFKIRIDSEYLRKLWNEEIPNKVNSNQLLALYVNAKEKLAKDPYFMDLYPNITLRESSVVTHQKCMEKTANYFNVNGKQFAHIHIPRTGGHSVAHNLGVKLSFAKASEISENTITLAFIRGPIRRIVSSYRYLKHAYFYQKEAIEDYNSLIADTTDFSDFFNKHVAIDNPEKLLNSTYFRPQTDFLTVNGEIKVDFVGRVEHLERDLNSFKSVYNIPDSELLTFNNSTSKCPRPFVTKEQGERLKEIYHRDIEMFKHATGKSFLQRITG